MTTEIKGISSMATRLVLAELVDAFQRRSGTRVAIESRGATLEAEVVGLPFWTKGTARGLPASG